jgi:hypothetical protein
MLGVSDLFSFVLVLNIMFELTVNLSESEKLHCGVSIILRRHTILSNSQ